MIRGIRCDQSLLAFHRLPTHHIAAPTTSTFLARASAAVRVTIADARPSKPTDQPLRDWSLSRRSGHLGLGWCQSTLGCPILLTGS